MLGKVADQPEKQMGPSAVRLHLLKSDLLDAGQFSAKRRNLLGTGSDAGIDGA
jgi:hypothetical protein